MEVKQQGVNLREYTNQLIEYSSQLTWEEESISELRCHMIDAPNQRKVYLTLHYALVCR